MKINGTAKFIIAGATATARKDGSGYFYQVSCIDPDTQEAGMLSCSEDVYNMITSKEFKRYTEHVATTVYDSQYKSMRVNQVQ